MSYEPPPPPPGYPPPYDAGYSMPQPRPTNVPAVTSLICGLALCIPFVTGLAAAILGVLGIRKANDPRYGGKGMAVAGLILGILSLAGWIIISSAVYYGYQRVKPGLALADTYLRDLSAGDVAAVQAQSTAALSAEEIGQLRQQVREFGDYRGFTPGGMNYSLNNGIARWEFTGRARFANGDQPATLILVSEGGLWKVSRVTVGGKTIE